MISNALVLHYYGRFEIQRRAPHYGVCARSFVRFLFRYSYTSSPKQRLGSDSPRDGNRAKKCREIIALKYCDTAYNGWITEQILNRKRNWPNKSMVKLYCHDSKERHQRFSYGEPVGCYIVNIQFLVILNCKSILFSFSL